MSMRGLRGRVRRLRIRLRVAGPREPITLPVFGAEDGLGDLFPGVPLEVNEERLIRDGLVRVVRVV